MTTLSAVFFGLFAVAALVDWYAVSRDRGEGRVTLEYVAKPLTLAFLTAACASLHDVDPTAKAWFVVALVFGLAGDLFLLVPDRYFVAGLASFLIGHLAYVVGFLVQPVEVVGLVAGALVVIAGLAVIGRPIVSAVSEEEPKLLAPVVAYIGVISAMVVVATGSLIPVAIAGGLLFFASDALIAWSKFVDPREWMRLGIITTYHLGQLGLVLSLLA